MTSGTRIEVDASRPLAEEPGSGHNRWHPDIPPVATVRPGEAITLETRDGLDVALRPDSTVADVAAIDLRLPHPLTGPVYVDGAEPGDVLEVEILEAKTDSFGVTCIVPGFGFLADLFGEPYLVKWRIEGGRARSDEIPGVGIPGDPFPGVIGVAPSHALTEAIHRREEELRSRGGAVADDAPEAAIPALAASGLRTIPPRETGGNVDIRQLVAGSKVFFPVHVPGALFSLGDLHFAQGDGETCGVAIEVAGEVTVRFGVRKDGGWPLRFPAYQTPERPARRSFATTGIPVTPDGRSESLDLTLATRGAVLEMIAYLEHAHGLSPEQAYVLVSVAVDLRLSEIVDVPNPIVSALLPLDIFEGATESGESAEGAALRGREDIARTRRRQEALDSLEYEQEREAMLRQRLEPIVRDAEAWRADELALAKLPPDEAETLRSIGFVQGRPPEDSLARLEAQIAELQAMIEDSQRRQRAFAGYAKALEE
jgi:formamidase